MVAALVVGWIVVQRTVIDNDAPPPITAPVLELEPVWTNPLDGAVYWDIDGFGGSDSPTVVTDAAIILRFGQQAYDGPASGVVALAPADGVRLWSVDLPDARCAETTLQVAGVVAVACAGEGSVVLLNANEGSVLMEAELAWNPQRVAASPAGITVIGQTDPQSGSTPVAWVGLDGTVVWESDLVDDPAFLNTLYPNDDGELQPWNFNVASAPGEVLFGHDGVAYRADEFGLSASFDCITIWVGQDGFACSESFSGPTVMKTWQGQEVWQIDAALAGYSLGWQTTAVLAEPNYRSPTQDLLAIDPATGRIGDAVVDMSDGGYATLRGTTEIPLLEYGREVLRLDPATGEALWRAPVDEYPVGYTVVAGDRVLIPGPDKGPDTVAYVVDASDGVAQSAVDWQLTLCDPVGGRKLLCVGYRGVEVFELP